MTVLAVLALVLLQSASPAPSPAAAASPAVAPSPAATPAPAAPAVAIPTAEEVVAVVQKSPEFGADSGRTGLSANPTKRAPVPGVGDLGYFVEIQWTDKQGAAHTGLAVVAHETVQGVPWVVKAMPWGLVKVLEDKTMEGVVGDLKRARLAANEAVAVGDIRTLVSAEMIFMGVTNGAYGDLRCLHVPAECIKDIPDEKLLEKAVMAPEKNGYRRTFHAGPRVASPKAKGTPSPFVKTFAFTAVPLTPGESGLRAFCGDSTGRVCVNADGAEPVVTGGLCAAPCTELK